MRRTLLLWTALACAAMLFGAAVTEAATPPSLLWEVPEDGQSGASAGRLLLPEALAVEPASGDIFLADGGNARIDQFTPWGQFVKAWGWGVVASGPDNQPPKNERQEYSVSGLGSSYKLRYFNAFSLQNGKSKRQETKAILSTATASVVEQALDELESLEPGDVSVTGPAGGPYVVEFMGSLADADIPPLTLLGTTTGKATTLQGGGSFEVCVRENGDVCQAGQSGGSAAGQVPAPVGGIAVDQSGHLYVRELINSNTGEEDSVRMQEFDLNGSFLAMWGGHVDKTTGADVCTKADLEGGDECGTGVPGSGPDQFQLLAKGIFGAAVAIGPGGDVFVGDIGRIQEFESGGALVGEVPVSGSVNALAVDQQGGFLASFNTEASGGVEPGIRKLSSSGTPIETLAPELRQIMALAVGNDGSLYAEGSQTLGGVVSIAKFSSTGSEEISPAAEFGSAGFIRGLATSGACGIAGEDLIESSGKGGEASLRAFGPPPDPNLCPPPVLPPEITDSFAASVTTEEAIVRTRINPKFWPDTRYRVEYGTGKCLEEGCGLVQPGIPGAELGTQVVSTPLLTEGVTLPGLAPDTTYHYRFVAESSGGGPVYGPEATFTTFPLPSQPETGCPNDAFRSGLSARLPDCRAYEMVTPVDKGNSDAVALLVEPENRTRAAIDQASVDGEKLTYGTYHAFGDAQSAPYDTQYMATRTSSGWSSHGISPPRGRLVVIPQLIVDSQFKGFSPDLCTSWVLQETDTLLAPGAVPGFSNLYRRQDCGQEAGAYNALTTVEPPNFPADEYIPELQGFSADGSHALIESRDSLTGTPYLGPDGRLLYEAFGAGELRLVCILPNGKPVTTSCSAGTFSSTFDHGRTEAVSHAISADGSRIFWSDAGIQEGQGKIYVRIKGKQTLAVSKEGEELTGNVQSQYWTAAADGSRAIFTVGRIPGDGGEEGSFQNGEADLYEFEVEPKKTTLIAHGVFGVMGASEDAQRIYFLSKEVLAPGGTAGKPNLYLHEAGKEEFTYIATLSSADARPGSNATYSPIDNEPPKHTAQVTPDGLQAVFMSTAPLTGAENTDAVSGEADAEVYRFDATTGRLDCISCSPTGARPTGRDIGTGNAPMWTASRLPLIQSELYPISRAISSDGTRVFFESFQPLVPTDTNNAQDVYEWEAPGTPGCKEESPSFSATAGGCVSLISSGEDQADAEIADTDPSGSNVFFITQSSLLPQDPGLFDIYDARVNGGYPAPPAPPLPCEGEECQPSSEESPNDPVPASSTFNGPGNLAPQPPHKNKKKHRKHRRHKKRHHRRGGSR